MVGIVVTTSPSFSLYNIVVFPAASRPTMRILISLWENIENRRAKADPIAAGDGNLCWWKGGEKQQHVWQVKNNPHTTANFQVLELSTFDK